MSCSFKNFLYFEKEWESTNTPIVEILFFPPCRNCLFICLSISIGRKSVILVASELVEKHIVPIPSPISFIQCVSRR